MSKIRQFIRAIWFSSQALKARGIIFFASEVVSGCQQERHRFAGEQGYELNLANPRSFNQKIVWKKIYDRNPLLPLTADKYLVREYVKSVLGEAEASSILIPLIFATARAEMIPFNHLPEDYIIKTNHDSGGSVIVRKGQDVNQEEVVSKFNRLLKRRYGVFKHEWAYKNIQPQVLIEKLILDEDGSIPKDYKFYVFNGKCRLVHVDFDRFANRSRSLFDPDWNFLPVTLKFLQGPNIDKPRNFDRMKSLAERLGRDFDFVRVDLYTVGDQVYFGELTHYPGSGMERFSPRSFDFELGEHWLIKNGK